MPAITAWSNSGKVVSGLFGSGVGALVVASWGYSGAFVLAGSIGLMAAGLAFMLRQPGRKNSYDRNR